jgi:hypothetical protein
LLFWVISWSVRNHYSKGGSLSFDQNMEILRRYDTQQSGTQQNDTEYNDTKYNSIQDKNTKQNNTKIKNTIHSNQQHYVKTVNKRLSVWHKCYTARLLFTILMWFILKVIVLTVVLVSNVMLSVIAFGV